MNLKSGPIKKINLNSISNRWCGDIKLEVGKSIIESIYINRIIGRTQYIQTGYQCISFPGIFVLFY